MARKVNLEQARRWFAQDIAEVAPVVHNPAIVDAFATVPREHFLGAGPWGIHSRLAIGDIHTSATTSPHHVYHDVLIAIDRDSGINNGLPSLWARVYDTLPLKAGATVLQIGAGVGYYTAILAELVQGHGHVLAYEIEPELAARAQENLKHYPNVEVICGDATQATALPDVDALTACAGVTHVPPIWLDSLKTGGALVLPYSGINHWGFLLHLSKEADALPVKSVGPVGVYPCAGARNDDEAQAITDALHASKPLSKTAIYHTDPAPDDKSRVWVEGQSYWIESV